MLKEIFTYVMRFYKSRDYTHFQISLKKLTKTKNPMY